MNIRRSLQFESGGGAGGRGKVDACVVIIDHHAYYATAAQSSAQFTVCTHIQQAVLQHKSSFFCVCVCEEFASSTSLLGFLFLFLFFLSFGPGAGPVVGNKRGRRQPQRPARRQKKYSRDR